MGRHVMMAASLHLEIAKELESVRGKMDAAVSRRKVLESELTSLRDKVSVVLDKTKNDDRWGALDDAPPCVF